MAINISNEFLNYCLVSNLNIRTTSTLKIPKKSIKSRYLLLSAGDLTRLAFLRWRWNEHVFLPLSPCPQSAVGWKWGMGFKLYVMISSVSTTVIILPDSDVVLYRRGCEGKNSDIFIGGAQRHVWLSPARAPTFSDFNLKVNEIILYR